MPKEKSNLEGTRKLMSALVRMQPKPHEEMKLGKKMPVKKAQNKRASAKPRSA
jgi:hypothetical protein